MRIKYLLGLLLSTCLLTACTKMKLRSTQPIPYETKMEHWKEATFGMFIHWGVWANLAGYWEGEKYPGYSEHIFRMANIPIQRYKDEVLSQFNPESFDADEWVTLCKEAGMKYLVFTAKHHDGVAVYDSRIPGWGDDYDVKDGTPFDRDPLMELKRACKKQGIMFGIYYSHAQDWSHPYGQRNTWDFQHPTQKYTWFEDPTWEEHKLKSAEYVNEKSIPQLIELIKRYEPAIIWFDTKGWLPEAYNRQIVQVAKELAPNAIINNRSAEGMADYIASGDKPLEIRPVDHLYWEAIPTTNESYGYHKGDLSHKPASHFVKLLSMAAAKGGNVLMNVGPRGDGKIDRADVHILKQIGAWMKTHGEAIYGFKKTVLPKQSWGETTMDEELLYLHVHRWPLDNQLMLSGLASGVKEVYALADPERKLEFERIDASSIAIKLPDKPLNDLLSIVVVECETNIESNDPGFVVTPTQAVNTLHAFYGEAVGEGLIYGSGAAHKNFVHNWSQADTYIQWPIKAYETHKYSVSILYDAKGDQFSEESVYKVNFGDQYFQQNIARKANFEEIELGTIMLPEGETMASIQITSLDSKELMRFRSLKLRPIDG